MPSGGREVGLVGKCNRLLPAVGLKLLGTSEIDLFFHRSLGVNRNFNLGLPVEIMVRKVGNHDGDSLIRLQVFAALPNIQPRERKVSSLRIVPILQLYREVLHVAITR